MKSLQRHSKLPTQPKTRSVVLRSLTIFWQLMAFSRQRVPYSWLASTKAYDFVESVYLTLEAKAATWSASCPRMLMLIVAVDSSPGVFFTFPI